MDRQSRIRRELQEAERQCERNIYLREFYLHFVWRRRFFLKELLKAQLEEFNHASGT